MSPPITPAVERRRVPGRDYELSEIAIDLAGVAVASEVSRRSAIAAFRRARAAGVTTFDLVSARDPALLETLLAEAFPSPDPELVTIVRPPAGSADPTDASFPGRIPRADAGPAFSRGSLDGTLTRLGRNRRLIVECTPGTTPGATTQVVRELRRLRSEGLLLDFVVPYRSAPSDRPEPPDPDLGLCSVALSLLETEPVRPTHGLGPDTGRGWIARNVFAGGLLDGTALGEIARSSERRGGPRGLRDLRTAFEPVLNLGFLTRGTGRTLAQAALRFVLAWPWVVAASVPLPAPERFEEILGYSRAPALSRAELSSLLSPSGASLAQPPPTGPESTV